MPKKLSTEDKAKIKKLLTLNKAPNLAIFDELREINDLLRKLVDKPDIEIPEFPEIPKVEIPPFPKTDLSETNQLLRQILQAQNNQMHRLNELELELRKPVEIEIDEED